MKEFRERLYLHKKSVEYLQDNEEQVYKENKHKFFTLNMIYFMIVVAFFLAGQTIFASWGVTSVYGLALVIHLFVMAFNVLRYSRKERSYREMHIVCAFFQLYCITFAGIMSIYPASKNQPAIYFAPIVMGFAVVFVSTYFHAIGMMLLEFGVYLVFSYIYKNQDVFIVDLCSSVLGMFITSYITYVMYNHRNEENDAKKRIRQSGMLDPLTGIYNRAGIELLSKTYIPENEDESSYLMIMDVDEFKKVNDTYGHSVGDKVLQEFGAILSYAAGSENIAGRFGGDEFTLMLRNVDEQQVLEKAQYILERTREIVAPDGTKPFSCSIGIAKRDSKKVLPEAYEEALNNADKALYEVKGAGKNGCKIFKN